MTQIKFDLRHPRDPRFPLLLALFRNYGVRYFWNHPSASFHQSL